MKIVKKILFAIITFLLVILLVFNIYNYISINVLDKKFTTINGYTILEVVSASMEPDIHVGDMIVINTKYTDYKVGDIVTFYDKSGALVTHQIIEMNDTNIITKGTNNDSQDEPITTDKLVGKYTHKLSGAGKIVAALKNPLSMVMILIAGVIACVFLSMDKEGNPILDEDEKEMAEFRKYKKELQTKNNVNKKTKQTPKVTKTVEKNNKHKK